MAQNTQDLVKQITALCESVAKLVHASDKQKETSTVDAAAEAPAENKWADVTLDWRLEEAVKAVNLCASSGALDVIKFLVDKFNLSANDVRDDCCGAFQKAAGGGHLDVVKYILDKYKIENDMLFSYYYALDAAVKGGHLDVIKFLVDKFNITVETVIGHPCESPFKCAILSGNLDVVKYFVETFNMTAESVSMEWVFKVTRDATKRYSMTNKNGTTCFQFASSPCKIVPSIFWDMYVWLPFTKHWEGYSKTHTGDIKRILKENGWKEGDVVDMAPVLEYFKGVFGRPNYSEEELGKQLTDIFGVQLGN